MVYIRLWRFYEFNSVYYDESDEKIKVDYIIGEDDYETTVYTLRDYPEDFDILEAIKNGNKEDGYNTMFFNEDGLLAESDEYSFAVNLNNEKDSSILRIKSPQSLWFVIL